MTIKSFGGGGGGTAVPYMVPHSETISGGALYHWPLTDAVETIVGGTVYDVTGTLVFTNPKKGDTGFSVLDCKRSTTMDTGAIGATLQIPGAITFACWVYQTANTASNLDPLSARIAGAGSANNTQWGFRSQASDQRMQMWWQDGAADNVNTVDSTVANPQNEWVHWCGTRPTAGTSGKLYKNGVLDTSTTGLNKADGGGNTDRCVFGNNRSGAEFQGDLFSCILYAEEFDATQVLALYNSTSSTGSWD